MADIEGPLPGPARTTYGRRRQISPLSEVDDDDVLAQHSSPAPLLFDRSPAARHGERKTTNGDDDTGNTSLVSSDDDDDEHGLTGDPVSRMRAKMGLMPATRLRSSQASASNGSSSLSSAPPLSQDHKSDIPSASEADSDELPSLAGRRGAIAGRMKKRGENAATDRNTARPRNSSSRSQSPSSSSDVTSSARKEREAADERKNKLAAMAAKRKVAQEVSLEDEFFGQAQRCDSTSNSNSNSQGEDPINSGSNTDEESENEDEVSQRLQRSMQSLKPRKSRPRASVPPKVKGPKPLSKKELEEMHKTSARIERSKHIPSLSSQSNPVNRLQYDIGTLAAKFALPRQRQAPTSDIAPVTDDAAISSDPIEAETPRADPAFKTREKSLEAQSSSPGILKSRAGVNRPPALALALDAAPDENDDDDDIDRTWSARDFVAAKQARERQRALKLKKEKWIIAMQAEAQKSDIMTGSSENTPDDDDDDIEIIPSKSSLALQTAQQPKVAMRLFQTDLAARQSQPGKMGGTKQPPRARRSGPPSSRQLDLQQSLLHKIKQQNIKARAAREQGNGATKTARSEAVSSEPIADDSIDALKMIQERAQRQGQGGDGLSGDEGSEKSDADFVPEGTELGSGSEAEDDPPRREGSDASDDEFGLDQAPPSSQNTHRSSGSITRAVSPDMDIDDDEDDEANDTLRVSRKSRVRAVVRDEDEDEDYVSATKSDRHQFSNGSDRESIELDGSTPPKESSSTESVSIKSSTGLGVPAGLTQYFTDTQLENDGDEQAIPESQQVPSRDELALGRAHPAPSDDSVLGQFFADTQVSAPARGESLDVIGATGRAKNAEIAPFIDESAGLSQFFEEGTQDPLSALAASAVRKTSQLMGPPATIPQDGFAALRRAAQAEDNLALSPDSLPSIDGDDVDDMDALPLAVGTPRSAHKTPKQYLNREGFFTQTRPDVASQWSQSQNESQDVLDQRRGSHASQLNHSEHEVEPGSPVLRRKRFKRAFNPDAESADDESDADGPVHQGSEVGDVEGSDGEMEGRDAAQPRDAWNVLREGASKAGKPEPPTEKKRKHREYQFLEGEAVESDEEAGDKAGRKGAGGLDGIWSDSGSEDDDEEEDAEDDGRDLDGLVDNEREQDEEIKDLLARERYQQDLDADEAAALALADKAARGELRKKRRGRDGEGRLEDLLDDDFDEERLMRKINNPRALMAKRRRVEGDEMDILAAKAESQAFVQGYSETHQADSCDQYGFLAAVDDSDVESQGGENSHQDEGAGSGDEDAQADEEVPMQRITRKQLAKELRDKRLRRKQGIVSDDEDGDGPRNRSPEAQRTLDPFASDESGDEGLPSFLTDRTAGKQRSTAAQAQEAQKPNAWGSANLAPASAATAAAEDDDDDYDDPSTALIGRLSRQKRATSPRTAKRLAQLADEFKSEPDFLAGRQQTYSSKGNAGASITSFGSAASKGKDRQKAGAGAFESSRRSVGTGGGQVKKTASAPVGGAGILAARRVEDSQ